MSKAVEKADEERERLEAQREATASQLKELEHKLEVMDAAQETAARLILRGQIEEQCRLKEQALLRQLRSERERQGLTQGQLAKRVESSASLLGLRELGKKSTGLRALVMWVKGLGMELVLVSEEGSRYFVSEEAEELAGLLRSRREEQGILEAELALRLGVSQQQQWQRENSPGPRGYTLGTILSWVQELGFELKLASGESQE